MPDAVVVGAGPNGLSAAIELARAGISVRVLEAAEEIGGGARSAELTLPGFVHDLCSGIHPMGALSPFWRELALERWGVQWLEPEIALAHPLELRTSPRWSVAASGGHRAASWDWRTGRPVRSATGPARHAWRPRRSTLP